MKQEIEQVTPKAWLSRAYKINEQITSQKRNVDFWRTLAEKKTSNPSQPLGSVGGITVEQDGTKYGVEVTGPRMEKYSTKIADALTENEKLLCDLIDIKREIEIVISYVQDTVHKLLLKERYVNWLSWGEIANVMRMHEVYVKQELHHAALKDAEIWIKIHLERPLI